MSCFYVIGIRMNNRTVNAVHFQETLTKNGCQLRARLGLHEAGGDVCANDGLIVLQPCGTKAEVESLTAELNALEGVTAKLIDLNG